MKNYLFFLLPLSLFSSDINFTKTFSSNIASDMTSNKIIISTSRDNSEDINTIFEKYTDLFKTNELISSKLQEDIKADYSTSRFNGVLSYQVKSYSFEKLNDFIKELLYLKDEKNLSLNIQNQESLLSEKLQENIIHNLRVKAIKFSKNYENRISSDLNKICKTKDIKIKETKTTNNNTNLLKVIVDYKLECN